MHFWLKANVGQDVWRYSVQHYVILWMQICVQFSHLCIFLIQVGAPTHTHTNGLEPLTSSPFEYGTSGLRGTHSHKIANIGQNVQTAETPFSLFLFIFPSFFGDSAATDVSARAIHIKIRDQLLKYSFFIRRLCVCVLVFFACSEIHLHEIRSKISERAFEYEMLHFVGLCSAHANKNPSVDNKAYSSLLSIVDNNKAHRWTNFIISHFA